MSRLFDVEAIDELADSLKQDLGDDLAEAGGTDARDAIEGVMADALDAEDSDEFFHRAAKGVRQVARQGVARPTANLIHRFIPLLRQYAAQGFDEMEALEDLTSQFSEEELDAAAPLLGGLAARMVARPQQRLTARLLPRQLRRPLVRSATQATRRLVQRQGPRAARALPRIAQAIGRQTVRHRLPARALPSAVRNVTTRVAGQRRLVRQLSQPTRAQLPRSRALASPPIPSATPRVLTYTTKDVIDRRISVPAQHSLVRLSKNPATSADAVGMLEEVKAGRLAGIYCVNWRIPAQRALRLGSNWWSVIPQGEDAVVMLDPNDLSGGQPLIAFRRELDPECGLMKREKRFTSSPSTLDAALIRGWQNYLRFREGEITPCSPVQDRLMLGVSTQPKSCPSPQCSASPCPSNLPERCKKEAPACSTDPSWGSRLSFQKMWDLIIQYYYCALPYICKCNPCCVPPLKLRDVFSPELLIAIFFEETRFANIPQKPKGNNRCGPAYGFGQVQKAVREQGSQVSAIWLACQFCGINPVWTPQDILCDDAKSVQIAGMLLWRLYCLGGQSKTRALLAYAGGQRRDLVNGWLDCEQRLKEIRRGSRQITLQEFRDALNQSLRGRNDIYKPSTDDPCVFPCGQLPNLNYTCPSTRIRY